MYVNPFRPNCPRFFLNFQRSNFLYKRSKTASLKRVIRIYWKKIRNFQHFFFKNVNFGKVVFFFNSRWRHQDGALNIGKMFKNANFAKISYFLYEKTMPDHCNEHNLQQYYLVVKIHLKLFEI